MKSKTKSYVIGILIALAVGGLSAFLTRGNTDIYDTVVKPPLAPPGILFPIVWTALYVLMGIGSVMVYNTVAAEKNKSRALLFYSVQLVFNFFWSILFFNKMAFLFSFIWLIALWALIVGMTVTFYRVNKTAAWLQVPYLLWVTFAGYLNFMVWQLNR